MPLARLQILSRIRWDSNRWPLCGNLLSTGEPLLDWSATEPIQPVLHARTFNAYDNGTGWSVGTISTCAHTSGAREPTKDSPIRPTRGKCRWTDGWPSYIVVPSNIYLFVPYIEYPLLELCCLEVYSCAWVTSFIILHNIRIYLQLYPNVCCCCYCSSFTYIDLLCMCVCVLCLNGVCCSCSLHIFNWLG